MDPITQAAGIGITKTFDYGLAITVLILGMVCSVLLVRYLLNRCDQRFDQSLQQHITTADKMAEVVKQNTVGFNEHTAAIRELKESIRDLRK